MRLWHKDLIPVLPKAQLVSQWRELLAIKGAIDKNGTPNHLLVNKVLNYSLMEFKMYATIVYHEMLFRGYKPSKIKYNELTSWECDKFNNKSETCGLVYETWHNIFYLRQCYFNLEEKYDCGGISQDEFDKIDDLYFDKTGE